MNFLMETISKIGAIWVTQWRLSIKSTSLSTDEMMDGLTKLIQEEVPKCKLFADDIVLANETRSEVNAKLEIWQDALEVKGFRLSKTKIEYMECKFSKSRNINEGVVRDDGQEMLKSNNFLYLGS